MLAVLFGIKCKKKLLAKQNNAKKSASTIGKRLGQNRKAVVVLRQTFTYEKKLIQQIIYVN